MAINRIYKWDKYFEKLRFADQVLKGTGQIMLQENRWTGLLFIIGLFIGGWQCGIAAITATIAGTVSARILKYGQKELDAGLYGFSPALVGVALTFLFNDTTLLWVLILIGGILAAAIQHFFIVQKIPVYTFPFIVVTWALVFFFKQYLDVSPTDLIPAKPGTAGYNYFLATTNGFGEVMFQGNSLSGFIFVIAVFISNPVAALYGLTASLLGAVLSQMNNQPFDQVQMGLFGFNALLTAIVFSETKQTSWLWALAGSVLTIIIHNLLIDYHLLDAVGGVLTFPFVAGTWITLLIQNMFLKKS